MLSVAENIKSVRDSLFPGVSLVAVSKFHPAAIIREAYDAGQILFGESRVQELVKKEPLLPSEIKWHFIGHLQTNKVRQLVPSVALIQSIDSEKLLRMVDRESERIGRVTDVLLQLHVALETTKFGFTCEECEALVDSGVVDSLHNVRICGVMGMATNTDNDAEIHKEFREIRRVFDYLSSGAMAGKDYFRTVSMGMSEDYRIAMEEGSTMVRIGTSIFGEREY